MDVCAGSLRRNERGRKHVLLATRSCNGGVGAIGKSRGRWLVGASLVVLLSSGRVVGQDGPH